MVRETYPQESALPLVGIVSGLRGCRVWLNGRQSGQIGKRARLVSAVRIVRYRLVLLLLAGLTSGCHSGKSDPGAAVQAPPPTVVAVAPEATVPHVKKPKAPVVPKPQIDELIGWNETKIKSVFGSPAAEEDHAPTKRWVYRVKQCTLDVTLYPEVETRQFQALNYEVNSDDGSTKRQQLCVAEFTSRLSAKLLAK
jgi:hypothetical protein